MDYALNQVRFHELGEDRGEAELLNRAITEGLHDDSILSNVEHERQEIVSLVKKKARYWRFREDVLDAYGYACTACGTQLDLVEAAHIIPVAEPRSHDSIANGLALCVLHHTAYDKAIIAFNPEYQVLYSNSALEMLRRENLADRSEEFLDMLNKDMLLPDETACYPDKDYLERGMQIRNWQG